MTEESHVILICHSFEWFSDRWKSIIECVGGFYLVNEDRTSISLGCQLIDTSLDVTTPYHIINTLLAVDCDYGPSIYCLKI